MRIKIWKNNIESRLKDIDSNFKIGILTGTFDPIHYGHVSIAKSSLEKNFGKYGNNLVLFYIQNFTNGKNPASQEFRVSIIESMIKNEDELGLIYMENRFLPNTMKPREFIEHLRENYYPNFSRIIGPDKIHISVECQKGIEHFVHPRGQALVLPENFRRLGCNYGNISSTDIRSGRTKLGSEYLPFAESIKKYYPNARFMTN